MTEEKDDIECRCRIGHFALDCPQASEYERQLWISEEKRKVVLLLSDGLHSVWGGQTESLRREGD